MKKYVVHRDIYVNSLIYLESVVPVPMIPFLYQIRALVSGVR